VRLRLSDPETPERNGENHPPEMPLTRTYLPCESFAEIESAPTYYFWDDRLPYGCFALIEGRKETGKSTLICSLVAALTAGRKLPGRTGKERAGVLWLQIEDDPRKTIRPRLEAAGANLDRVIHVGRDKNRRVRVQLPEDTDALVQLAVDKQARMIIIEPLASFVRASLRIGDEQDARLALEPLVQKAQDNDLLIIGQRHLTKGKQDAVSQGLGSVAIANLARSILRCDFHPAKKGKRVVWRVAGNQGKPPPAIAYHIEDQDGVGRLVWEGECDLEGDRIEADQDAGTRDVVGDAVRLLKARIHDNWVPYQQLIGEAISAGISERTLRSAKARLGVRSQRKNVNNEARWYWGPPKGGWPA